MIEDDAYGFMEPDAAANYAAVASGADILCAWVEQELCAADADGVRGVSGAFVVEMENVIRNTTTGTSLVHNAAAMRLIEDGTLEQGDRREGGGGGSAKCVGTGDFG